MELQHASSPPAEESQDVRSDRLQRSSNSVFDDSTPIEWVPISVLLPADSPRQRGENIEHTRMLASMDVRFPPIIVHRSTMRVIDGMHRLGATRIRGDEKIEVRFFDGTEHEAFILAVETNIAHGLPLSRADRMRAAQRIIASDPTWSDRAIAAAAGLSARTVGNVRRRVQPGLGGEVKARMGRDGRVRPLDHVEGRVRASEIIRERPGASLREIARDAGVSPSTVRDVRRRLQRGEDPVQQLRIPGPRRGELLSNGLEDDESAVESRLALMLHGLKSDPSLRLTESGRSLLRWVFSRTIRPEEWRDVATNVPPHCTYILAEVARACADEWLQIANDLENRSGAMERERRGREVGGFRPTVARTQLDGTTPGRGQALDGQASSPPLPTHVRSSERWSR
ncbi:MAG TPA: helix-turn-helix domain-containing protein [Micromonosporaceae bacterium]|nr:helix-turn-helix domain-containing protein [Micromonosporaceae bacterium]